MARQLRIAFESAFYHVTSRGNTRQPIFFDDKDRERFIEVLKRAKERYAYLLHAYALMDNHYHLLLETPRANLSRIMQTINTSYTVYVNKRHDRTGHLFQGRFKAIVVEKDAYLLELSRYIHLNPVRAGLVLQPEAYRWTSYTSFIEPTEEGLVERAATLSYFGTGLQRARERYQAFVMAPVSGSPLQNLTRPILGSDAFVARVASHGGASPADEEIPRAQRLTATPSIPAIVAACASFYAIPQTHLLSRGKRKPHRELAVYLAKVASGSTNKEVGAFFGIKGSAVSEIMKRAERRQKEDADFRSKVAELRKQLNIEY